MLEGPYVCLQLVLEKVCIAIGGMFMLIGAGLHIAKEVGWMVSKGQCTPYIPAPPRVHLIDCAALEKTSLKWLLSRQPATALKRWADAAASSEDAGMHALFRAGWEPRVC